MAITLKKNEEISRTEIIKKFINARYERNDVELVAGNFRVKGATIDIIPADSQEGGGQACIFQLLKHKDTLHGMVVRSPQRLWPACQPTILKGNNWVTAPLRATTRCAETLRSTSQRVWIAASALAPAV